MTRIKRQQIALEIIGGPDQISDDDLHYLLQRKFGNVDEDEVDEVIDILFDDRMIVEDDYSYSITQVGRDYLEAGGYVREHRLNSLKGWMSGIGVLISLFALIISALNYHSSIKTSDIQRLDKRIDSLQKK